MGRHPKPFTEADTGPLEIDDEFVATDRVRLLWYCVFRSDLDLLGDLDCVVDAEVANGPFNLGMPERLGFILRISFLIENQRSAARRLVLADAERSSSRQKTQDLPP